MNDLEKMALVLIYPDGEVEKIPITSYVFHIEYMIKLRTVSQRFARVTLNCNFTDSLHEDIDTALVINGIIVLFNLSIYDIVRYSNLIDDIDPYQVEEFLKNEKSLLSELSL